MKTNTRKSIAEEETAELLHNMQPRSTNTSDAPEVSLLPENESTPEESPLSAPPSSDLPLLAQSQSDIAPTTITVINQEGNFNEGWWEHFDSLKPFAKTLQKFKSPETLAKSYAELEKIRKYPDPEDGERMEKYRQWLGIDNEENYRIHKPELLEQFEKEFIVDGLWDEALISKLQQTAHRYAIPQEALQALSNVYINEQIDYYKNCAKNEGENITEAPSPAEPEPYSYETHEQLHKEWGSHYNSKMSIAGHTLDRLCSEIGIDAKKIANHPVMGSSIELIKLLSHVGSLTHDPEIKGLNTPSESLHTDEIQRMESDSTHPLYEAYNNHKHPNHKYANAYYDKLILRK